MSDYTIDWSHTNVDGNNHINGPEGAIGVSVSTPKNAEGKQWFVENGMLKNWDVTSNSSADITFSQEVENVNFTLLDVDALDKITIMTKDEHGNPVEVQFEATGVHDVNGNVVTGTQTNAPGPGDTNNGQDIDIHIPGPVKTFWIVLDNGPERHYSGTVAVSDIHFDVPAQEDGYVDGTAGNDTIDVAYAGDPDGDKIDNNDAILPGEGNNDDIVLAGAGNDTVKSGNGDDEVYGGNGDDMIFAGNGNDVVYGGRGDDKVEASDGEDVVIGGKGNDDIWGGLKDDVLSGGEGHDNINAGDGDDVASGGKGNDTIQMGNGDDLAFGGVGADSITGGAGNDTLIGGSQSYNGTQDFNDLSAGELVDGQYVAEGVTITSGDPKTPVMAFDTANPTGGDDDLATGNLGKVLILSEDRDGSDPDDNASGGSFFINFENPASVTALTLLDADGGAWVKYYDMNGNLLQQVDVTTANNGQHVVNTNLHNVAQIEVILGSSGAIDNLTYSINPDNMDGNDVIAGGDGDDIIDGNAGNDELSGDAGNDTISGGLGDDDMFGGEGNDRLIGGNGDDEMFGGAGNDVLLGGAGDDYAEGGAGNEEIWMGTGDDVVFGGDGNDWMHGQDGNDELNGGAGDDMLFGENGDDTLDGGEGADMLKGGEGSDLILGGAGDTVDGGATGTDHDVLDLTGQGPFYLEGVVSDTTTGGNGNGFNGTVVFVDADGEPTGETLTFTDIEEIIGDEVNRGPDAADDTAEVDEDGSVDITVLGNDSDPDGDDLEVTEATSPDGDVTINADGTITFEPAENFNGETTITYTVDDGNGGTDTATVTVTVNPVNDDPIANDDTAETDEDTPVDITVLGNDTDVDGDDLTVTEATSPNGTVDINPDGTITFTPDENFNGETTITYTVDDGNGGTDTATVTVTVGAENDGPVANDDDGATDQDTAIALDNVLDNDTDADGDTLEVIRVEGMTGNVGDPVDGDNGGLITINDDGTASFDPNGDFDDLGTGDTAETSVMYTVSDGNGGQAIATVTVTVTGTNDAPEATNSSYIVSQDEEFGDNDGNAITDDTGEGVDSDVDGDALTVAEVNGDAANVGAPIAGDNGGEFIINADGTVDFSANGDFDDLGDGEEASTTVTYTITDPEGGEDTATVTFTVTGTNDGPVAVEDTATVDENNDPTDVIVNVLDNDEDPDGDVLEVSEVNGDPAGVGEPVEGSDGGLVTINEDGTVTFDPNGDFEDLDEGEEATTTVTYTVTDPDGSTATETVTITVTGTNDAPVATADVDSTDQDTVIALDNVLGNDTDPEDDPLTVSEVNGDAANVGQPIAGDNGGLITINEDGTASFDPNGEFDDLADGEEATTEVTYTIVDDNGLTDTTTVTVTVTGTNDGPVATADTDETDQDTTIVLDNVLGNDTDPDGDDLTVSEVNGDPAGVGQPIAGDNGGLITINEDGTASFDPNGEFDELPTGETAETTVSYTITDQDGQTDTTTVTVTVTGLNDAPEANDDADTTDFNTAVDVNLLANDTDVDGDDLTVISATVPAEEGTIEDNGDGTWKFTPALGFAGVATISYVIEDEEGLTDEAIHTVTVAAGTLDGTVEGTDGDDIIDGGYMGDPDGDMVDNDDAILPGDVGDDDLIYGFGGDDTIVAGAGDDEVFGGEGDDVITGKGGNDTLSGDQGNDDITGGKDDDTIFGGSGDDTLDGDSGNDSIGGGAGDDSILGGGGDDVITGGQGNDTINGENNDDMIDGGAGDDVLDGGSGDDKIEGGSGDDTIIGGTGNDDLWGASGDDSVDGGAGNDTIATAEGNDVVDGGDGNDTIDTSNDQVPLPDLSFGDIIPADGDLPGSSPTDDLDTVFGGAGNDTITTGDDADVIFGGTGRDVIDGGIDADEIFGGDGNDTIIGGEGSDTIEGGEGNDTIFAGLEPGTNLFGIPEQIDDNLGDPEPDNGDDTVFGGAGNDTIFGADDSDVLYGDEGNDVINGEIDDDTLFGGEGDDILDGGANDDVIEGGDGDDEITGGTGVDDLSGGQGSDVFLGGNGGDVVVGGEDDDDSDVDVLDLTGSNVDFITYEDNDPEAGTVTFQDGSTMTFSEIENVIPCFTPGTTIATPKGERLVEELREGDRIITRDNGIQEIRWAGRKEMTGKQLVANPHLKPILVRAGSLGNGLPERDMLVSPNHRLLVASDKTQLYFEEREVLAAAKHLVGSEGIHAVDVMGTAYIHFMFDNHEVVLSNGAWTESFQPGDYSLKGIGNAQRNEIFELFPELQEKQGLEGYQSARRALKKHEAKLLVK